MPWFVNSELVPETLIRQEMGRIGRDPQWNAIPNEVERDLQLRRAAEQSAIDRVLIEQHARRDPRPIEPGMFAREMERLRGSWGGEVYDETGMHSFVDRQLRVERANRELVENAAPATEEEVKAFFDANHRSFPKPGMFRASHIVKYINREKSESGARAGIEAALAALEKGEPFSEVADRLSDCGDKGGDLGQFPAGHMVDEFETVLLALEPGQRSGIFCTPFGLHIAQLHEKQPAGLATFEDVRAEIERVLSFAKRHGAYAASVAKLRETAQIRFVQAAHAGPPQ